MSLILDALKRAERERQAERSPVLGDVPATPAPQRTRRWALRAVVVTVILAAGVAAFWSTRTDPPPTERAAVPPAATPPSQPETTPEDEAAMADDDAAPPDEPAVVPGTEGVASLDDLTADTEAAPAAPLPLVDEPAPPAPASQPAAPTQEPEPAATDREESAPAPAAPAAPPPAATRPVPPSLTQPAPRRKLREMPPEYRADFPALTVDVHVYERDIARRFAIVNGRRYREGERLAEGPVLVEIARDGLVLDYRGEKVLFPLGR